MINQLGSQLWVQLNNQLVYDQLWWQLGDRLESQRWQLGKQLREAYDDNN